MCNRVPESIISVKDFGIRLLPLAVLRNGIPLRIGNPPYSEPISLHRLEVAQFTSESARRYRRSSPMTRDFSPAAPESLAHGRHRLSDQTSVPPATEFLANKGPLAADYRREKPRRSRG